MKLSWRGLVECIECFPGDYCEGCDVFEECPQNDAQNRDPTMVSAAGSTGIDDCVACAAGQEASLDNRTCIDNYKEECDVRRVNRCVRGCKEVDFTMSAHDIACERMKCEMYCAKQYSDSCAKALSAYCVYLTETPYYIQQYDEKETFLNPHMCDVDCSSASPRSFWSAISIAVAAWVILCSESLDHTR